MRPYFPQATRRQLAPGLDTLEFAFSAGVLLVSEIAPGARLPWHAHDEVQMGLCLAGAFTMQLPDQEVDLHPFAKTYCVASGESHAAQNLQNEPAVGLDLKMHRYSATTSVLDIVAPAPGANGSSAAIGAAVGPWFDLTRFALEPVAEVVVHSTKSLAIGIVTTGTFSVAIGERNKRCSRFDVFVMPTPSTTARIHCHERGSFVIVSVATESATGQEA